MLLFDTRVDMIKELVPQSSVISEIGVFRGDFMKQIVSILNPNIFIAIDIFSGYVGSGDQDGNNFITCNLDEEYLKLIEYFKLNTAVKFIKGYSTPSLITFPNDYFDMIYIDADHSYEGCKKDLDVSFNKIKQSGWIMGHDYGQNFLKSKTEYEFGVKQAVDEFCIKYNQTIYAKANDGCISFAIKISK